MKFSTGVQFLKKWKIQGVGGGVLCEIPSLVGLWMFSGTKHLGQET